MYKVCKTEQSAQRQRTLEEGLLEAMTQYHYEELSVIDLCDRMAIPRKSFYRYFSGKEGALHALIDHTLMRYDSSELWLSKGDRNAVIQELIHFFSFWIGQKTLLDALAKSSLSGVLIQRSIEYALGEAGARRKQGNADMGEMEYGIMFAISGLMTMTVQWHHNGYNVGVDQMAAFAERVLTRPLLELG